MSFGSGCYPHQPGREATFNTTGKSVIQNATKNTAMYLTKAQLSAFAANMHKNLPPPAVALFSATLGSPNTLQVNVDASTSTCNGSNANCTGYDWNWGDGTANGTGVTATHTYAAAGTKTITLTVTGTGASPGSASVNIAVYAPDNPPTPGNTGFAFNLNNWTASFTDSSTDDNGVYQVTVDWGDHTVLTTQAQGTLFTHTYLNPEPTRSLRRYMTPRPTRRLPSFQMQAHLPTSAYPVP